MATYKPLTMTVNSTISTWCYDTADWLTARGTRCTVHSEQGVDMGQWRVGS